MTVGIEDRVFHRIDSVGYDNLTEAEKCYWLIWIVEAEANNGGLEQFFDNSSGSLAEETVIALDKIGAHNMASLLKKAAVSANNFGTSDDNSEIRSISNEFTDYPDDLGTLLDKYVENNASSFLGPKTEAELWEQKKALGKSTAPQVVTRDIDFYKEAEIDAKYSSRKCPECLQPVPDYRKTCKKCGYPIGRA